MMARKVPTIKLEYPKHWFLVGAIVWVSLTIALLYLSLSSVEHSIAVFWIAAGVLEGVAMFLLVVQPLFTGHVAGAKALKLRMGLLIREDIPYEWIKEVRQTSIHRGAFRVGIGVRYAPIMKALFVTSSFRDLVVVRLDKEHVMGRLMRRPVLEIVLSVTSSQMFIDAIKQRIGMMEVKRLASD